MGNCLRLGISRVGLAWSKWRMAAKFKRKNVSIIILGMQAVGKSTIALRLYKFKKTLPDTNYVQTKGFNTYTVKRKKTTVNIYDLGGHPSIQELWDHYYADSHGVVFVVDTSKRETVPEAGQLLSQVLNDHRIRGKPVLLLANKVDLDGVTENELDTMLNLQQLVNSVRCMTRLDISCATDLKDDKGIFEGYKWLISYIESNYQDLNTRVLSDTEEEKNREKARRAVVKAARDAEKAAEEEEAQLNGLTPGTPLASSTPVENRRSSEANGPFPNDAVKTENEEAVPTPPNPVPSSAGARSNGSGSNSNQEKGALRTPSPKPRPISVTRLPSEPAPVSKIPLPLLPSISSAVAAPSVDQPVKLPRLKSPKSKPEIINRIEDTGVAGFASGVKGSSGGGGEIYPPAPGSDQYYDEKGFRFRKISAARRLSPEGADSDDGIVNMAYEPTEDVSSDSTPIGVRKHNFSAGAADEDLPNKELFMITTLAEVHKEYFKDRKGSTSTHDSVSMSVASIKSDTTDVGDDAQSAHPSLNGLQTDASENTAENTPNKQLAAGAAKKGNKKKRLNTLKPRNKTGPAPPVPVTPVPLGTPKFGSPLVNRGLPQKISVNPASSLSEKVVKSRTPSASSKTSASGKVPFTVSNAWASSEIPEHLEMNGLTGVGGSAKNGRY